jgi:hypothetical protein
MNQEERDAIRSKHVYMGYNSLATSFACSTCGIIDEKYCDVIKLLDIIEHAIKVLGEDMRSAMKVVAALMILNGVDAHD